MVEPGDNVPDTLIKEFCEEALNIDTMAPDLKTTTFNKVRDDIFHVGVEVYRGVVEHDPRNTDNAWMETIVTVFHHDKKTLEDMKLKAGSDASRVKWMTVDENLQLYASHSDFMKLVCTKLGAFEFWN
eukprot:158249_1